MLIQLLSDLHLESQEVPPIAPAPGAEVLVLAGDIDRRWEGLARFAAWPVPVLMVAGNHEFDGRDLEQDLPALRAHAASHGVRLLECESCIVPARDGRRVRFLGTTRWSDFDAFGEARRPQAMRAAEWFLKLMNARRGGQPLDAASLRAHALACRDWLATALSQPSPEAGEGCWDATVVVTHYAPSLRSADARYGLQAGTASFCNADDDLLPQAALWLHGHLHAASDYRAGGTRVVARPMGLARKGEAQGWDPWAWVRLEDGRAGAPSAMTPAANPPADAPPQSLPQTPMGH